MQKGRKKYIEIIVRNFKKENISNFIIILFVNFLSFYVMEYRR